MRKILTIVGASLTFFFMINSASATWQLEKLSTHAALSYKYKMHVYKGTLEYNIDRFAKAYGWKVIWRSNQAKGYRVLSKTTITDRTFPLTLDQLLANFPVKATYYEEQKRVLIFDKGFTGKLHKLYKKGKNLYRK